MTKAREAERRVVQLYQDAGYETYLPPKAKYRDQDVFGLFDVLAFGHDRLEAAQVKMNRARGINNWFDQAWHYEEHVDDLRLSFVVEYEDEGYKVARTAGAGYRWVYDGRDVATDDDGPLLDVLRS